MQALQIITTLWTVVRLDDICIVILDFYGLIICHSHHLDNRETGRRTGGVTVTSNWGLGVTWVLPDGTAITSHQLANGVNCHTQGGPQLTVCLKPMQKLI